MSSFTHPQPRSPRPRWRRLGLVAAVFGGWSVGVSVLVADLARVGCALPRVPAVAAVSSGWTLRYDLDPSHPEAERVAHFLLGRGPTLGAQESVVLHRDRPDLRQALEAAGWRVSVAVGDALARVPALQVIAPTGTMAWTGYFNPADLAAPDGEILGAALLAEVAQGRTPPPIVPVACALPIRST